MKVCVKNSLQEKDLEAHKIKNEADNSATVSVTTSSFTTLVWEMLL